MNLTTSTRRGWLGATSVALVAAVLAACGSGSTPSASPSEEATASASEESPAPEETGDAAFPVTINHVYGSTVIEEQPQRVVTVSWANQDSPIALGVVPVAIPFADYGGDADGWLPWTLAALEALGDERPVLLSEADGLPFEDIATQAPDLILATYSGITQEDYDTLSAIAPTVAYPEEAWATDWRTQTLVSGAALGKTAEAEQLVAQVEQTIADGVAAYPQIAGKTFAYLWFNSADPSTVTFYTPTDARVAFVESLGLVSAPKIVELSDGLDAFYGTFSAELADQIDADIVFAYVDSDEHWAAVQADPLLSTIPAVASGAVVPLTDPTFILSTSAPSALSIPWAVDNYLPEIAEAADRVQ